jgi:hypothetical protein
MQPDERPGVFAGRQSSSVQRLPPRWAETCLLEPRGSTKNKNFLKPALTGAAANPFRVGSVLTAVIVSTLEPTTGKFQKQSTPIAWNPGNPDPDGIQLAKNWKQTSKPDQAERRSVNG